MNATEFEKLYQLNTMVLKDRLPPGIRESVYLFTETPDNQESVLQEGARLFHEGRALRILLIDNQGRSEPGYPGAPPWQKRLRELNVPDKKVILIRFSGPILHTLSEALAMVDFAKECRRDTVIMVAPPFHMARCFLSMVTAVRDSYSKLRVYTVAGVTEPWNEPALHSQKVRDLRKNLIIHEFRRIRRYQRRSKLLRLATDGLMFLKAAWLDGTLVEKLRKVRQYAKLGSPIPLVSTDEALRYLEWRDTQ